MRNVSSWTRRSALVSLFLLLAAGTWGAEPPAGKFASHPPTRPLPVASSRPLGEGRGFFVHPTQGSDENDGSASRPWKTIQHGHDQLQPGDTLYLRQGVYFEHVEWTRSGTAERPITLRSHPGELAVIDGGIPEFFHNPALAWEPFPDGAPGEFRSTATYPGLGTANSQPNLLGNFADSMVPLHGYRFLSDLRSDNPYWNVDQKVGADPEGVYCGPGVHYVPETERIHIRLAPTRLPGLGDDNYRGESDPRKVRLVIAAGVHGPALRLRGARHVRLVDLAVRGARTATCEITDGADIALDGVTAYGGSSPILVRDTVGVRVLNTACRGLAAPWTFRGSLKYRSIESRLFTASHWDPTGADSRDLELAWCEFTDSVDGVFIGNVRGVEFHHNLVDNVSDDGIFLTAGTAYDGSTPGGDVQIYQNLLSRCLTTFAFGVGHGRQRATDKGVQTGAGVYIYRNVFDFRRPVMYHWPSGPDDEQQITSLGRVAGDHGSPAWEPMWIYHNTILAGDTPRYDYGTDGLGRALGKGTRRRVFNNIICQMIGLPGETLPPPTADFQADGNLFWSVAEGPAFTGKLFAKFRQSPALEQSKQQYAAGWTSRDQFADPRFVAYDLDWRHGVDLRLAADSPALDAGVPLPQDWPDPLRAVDKGPPDIGALPRAANAWSVGVRGRLNVFGAQTTSAPSTTAIASAPLNERVDDAAVVKSVKPAAIIEGYPAFDSPILEFALRRQRVPVDVHLRTWLDPREYEKYSLVAIVGDLARAKIEHNRYDAQDLPRVREFLERGGTLLLMRGTAAVFGAPEGKSMLEGWTGLGPVKLPPGQEILEPDHPWVRHLEPQEPHPWLSAKNAAPLRAVRGQRIIGNPQGTALLYRVPVGQGQLIYVGWEIAASIPNGREASTVEKERSLEEQVQVLLRLVASLYPFPESPAGTASPSGR